MAFAATGKVQSAGADLFLTSGVQTAETTTTEFRAEVEGQNEIWEPITRPFVLTHAYALGIYEEGKKKKPLPIVGERVAEARRLFAQRSMEKRSSSKNDGVTTKEKGKPSSSSETTVGVVPRQQPPEKTHR